jgi:hypothetical protein
MATGTDTVSQAERAAYKIPHATSPGRVTIINPAVDTATCRRAHTAYAKITGADTMAGPPVDVISIWGAAGHVYVVTDYQRHAGEFGIDAVFDTSFTYLAGMTE